MVEQWPATPAAPAFCERWRIPCAGFEPNTSTIYQVHWPDPLIEIEGNRRSHARIIQAGENPCHRRKQLFRSTRWSDSVASRHCMCCSRHTICFERGIEADLLPYCRENKIAMLGYGRCAGASCRDACERIRFSVATI